MKAAVFLDRDGVVVADKNYQYRVSDLELLSGSAEAIKKLNDAGYMVIMVSNQSGIARGYFTEDELKSFNTAMTNKLEKAGARIDAVYYCPHHRDAKLEAYRRDCGCRKPLPGMLLKAEKEHGILLSESWMIGDKASDVQAGKAAGCRTIFIGSERNEADHSANDLYEAVEYILHSR